MGRIVLITGGFDPLHAGHISYINSAKKLAGKTGKLIVGINSDAWLKAKKDYVVLSSEERATIIESLRAVDSVIEFDDLDGTAIAALKQVKNQHPKDEIIFANGGDRTEDNIPEMEVVDVEFVFGVGGENKCNSSSRIITSASNQIKETVKRKWGSYNVLYSTPNCKVKELIVDPGKNISLQKHEFRSETWKLIKGQCNVGLGPSPTNLKFDNLVPGYIIMVPVNVWHILANTGSEPATLIEIQTGNKLVETDIIRC